MGIFDNDPKFEELKRIREDEGYQGPVDQDLNKVGDLDRWLKEHGR